ncbi:helix-turn-helix domain-containing protein [Bifidobacterium sp. ESL0784]|uniref:helix-turn-helix transcriptional regulator n=1 Tax=Bifidobacterium sp. ESL0784 TaxID=2983231 RepID=UPI0023F7EC5A|nr:helix-turn-helix domain-containing protein [Bifidobacterium sp. ESL0784]MDF7641752.1 helix-turn-helix domain-containing protein [Bifidobacterium sp. ESL0784]
MARTLEDDEILTTQQAADILKVTRNYLSQLRFHEEGPKFVQCGRRTIRYWKSDIQKWLDENLHQSTAEYT